MLQDIVTIRGKQGHVMAGLNPKSQTFTNSIWDLRQALGAEKA